MDMKSIKEAYALTRDYMESNPNTKCKNKFVFTLLNCVDDLISLNENLLARNHSLDSELNHLTVKHSALSFNYRQLNDTYKLQITELSKQKQAYEHLDGYYKHKLHIDEVSQQHRTDAIKSVDEENDRLRNRIQELHSELETSQRRHGELIAHYEALHPKSVNSYSHPLHIVNKIVDTIEELTTPDSLNKGNDLISGIIGRREADGKIPANGAQFLIPPVHPNLPCVCVETPEQNTLKPRFNRADDDGATIGYMYIFGDKVECSTCEDTKKVRVPGHSSYVSVDCPVCVDEIKDCEHCSNVGHIKKPSPLGGYHFVVCECQL